MAAPIISLANELAKQEEPLTQLVKLLKGSQYDDTRKDLNSLLNGIQSMHKFLSGLAAKPTGAVVTITINRCQAHALKTMRFINNVDSATLPPDAAEKFSAFVREHSNWDNELTGFIEKSAQAPAAPANVTAVASGIGQVTVNWRPVVAAQDIPIADHAITAILTTAAPDGTTTTTTTEQWVGRGMTNADGTVSAIATNLRDGGTYTFTVRAVNDYGEGTDSAPSAAVMLPDVPAAPTGVAATRGIDEATVTWTAPAANPLAPITDFIITAILTTVAANGVPVTTTAEQWVGRGATSARMATLSQGGMYTFTVRAVNTIGEGADSAPSAAITLPDVPAAPRDVTANAGIREATVHWAAPPADPLVPITAFIIMPTLISAAGNTTLPPVKAGGGDTSAIVTGLSNGGAYTFAVAGVNAIGTGPQSAPSARITLPDVPGKPTNVQVVPAIGQMTVSWTAPGDGGRPLSAFIIDYIDDATTAHARTKEVDKATTEATINDLARGHTYTVTVTARNEVGDGAASDPVRILVLSDYPVYHTLQEVVRASAQVVSTDHVDDDALIRHLRGVGETFKKLSRDPYFGGLAGQDKEIEALVGNWSKAMDKLSVPTDPGDTPDDGNVAVDRLIRIHDWLDKDYEFLRGGYSSSHPFDLGDL